MNLLTPYNYEPKAHAAAFALSKFDKSLTQQSFAEECDINTIVKRFGLDGTLPVGVRMPTYGDFSGVDDYKSALLAIMAARDSFAQMPARVRLRFENDPQKFVEFCSDPANKEEAIKLGLVEAPAAAPAAPAAPGAAAAAPAGG